jgi:hypothetical protein
VLQQQEVRQPNFPKGRKGGEMGVESILVKEREAGRWLTFFIEVAKKTW